MKKGLVLIVLLSFGLFFNLPVAAQRANAVQNSSNTAKVSVKYGGAQAFSDGRGVWLEWNTDFESKNLGFYIYRVSGDKKESVNDSLIPGLYLQMRDASTTGGKYTYFDARGDLNSSYFIESLSISGQKETLGAIHPKAVKDLTEIAGASSDFLSEQAKNANPVISRGENVLPIDLKTEIEANSFQPDPVAQRWVAAQPGVKIGVKKEGFYRVTRAELEAAGFNVNAPTDFWQLYKNGVEQAINIGGSGDYIEFYGSGIDTRDTDTQIYFLVVGAESGKRIGTIFRRTAGGRVLTNNFDQTATYKERTIYSTGIFNGEEENFFGRVVNNTPVTIPINLPAVDTNAANASIDLKIQGLTNAPHQVKVVLNNVELGFLTGNNAVSMNQHFDIPGSLLASGANNLQLAAISGTSDVCLFDTVKINYARRFEANQNQLSFYVPNYKASYVENFSTPNIRVLDISVADRPNVIDALPIEENNGAYRVYLPSNRGRVLFAVEDSGVLSAASVKPNVPSAITNAASSADLIIISYKDFMNEANNWANYRRAQGMTVDVVNVEDVYDEFSYGAVSSYAVKDYLQNAYTSRQTPPAYVLLIGDASYDPRNYVGLGAINLVPTKMVETIYLETGSDEALADFNDDGLAEIAVGRIPAQNAQTVAMALNKVSAFEQTVAAGQGLTRGAVFASDLPDGYDFEASSNRLRNQLPAAIPSVSVNRGQANARATLLAELNSGKFIANYSGHGNTNVWATSGFFGLGDAASLTNSNLTIFTMLTCLNGYFIQPTDALAEVLLKRENGGAVAAWASTGLTTPDIQEIMALRFFNQLGADNSMRLGDLIKDAKTTLSGGRDVRLSWVLLGDPALKVK